MARSRAKERFASVTIVLWEKSSKKTTRGWENDLCLSLLFLRNHVLAGGGSYGLNLDFLSLELDWSGQLGLYLAFGYSWKIDFNYGGIIGGIGLGFELVLLMDLD